MPTISQPLLYVMAADGSMLELNKAAEIAPNVYLDAASKAGGLSHVGIPALITAGPGIFKAVIKVRPRMARLGRKLAAQLSTGLSSRILRTLVYAKFVRGSQPTPHCTMIDLADLYRHLAEATPGWWTPERRATYSAAWTAAAAESALADDPDNDNDDDDDQ